jgi:3-hydroxybutyryl-CoA dehydrogenase
MIIGVVGSGVMGRGIAQLFVQSGHEVRLFDARAGAAEEARGAIIAMLARVVAKGGMTEAELDAAGSRLQVCAALSALAGCELVAEAIIEELGAKQALFAELEPILGEAAILASNTSSLTVSAIAARCAVPGRVAGLHFFNPVPLMKIAEIIPGIRTEPAVVESLRALIAATGHQAVTAADQPGFLINHAGRGLYGEGFRIVEEGVADFATVDRIMRACCEFRMGPFELLDLTGLDVSSKVMQSIFEQFQQEPRYRPSALVPPRIAAGLFGRKTGEGFYKYDNGRKLEPAEPAVPAGARSCAVYIGEGDRREELAGILDAAGVRLADRPDGDAANLIMPWGEDVTTAALRLGLDPARTLGIDPLPRWDRRRVLMTCPATRPELRDALAGALAAGGLGVSMIADSPGFVAQRMIAMIVNIACEIAQRGIARAEEIDLAIRLGLGYPAGPLELGDRIGPGRILKILETIEAITGDPRYRPSLWLRRRAMLGLSLLQAAA